MNDSESKQEELNAQDQWRDRFSDPVEGRAGDEADREQSAAERAAEKAADCKDCGGQPCMPKPTFSTFVLSLASSALVQLGEVPDPSTGQLQEDLALAKHSIDILSMLQDKIHKGLDAEEERLLNGLLYELRMKFVMKK